MVELVRRRRARSLTSLVTGLVVAVLLAGCGSGGQPNNLPPSGELLGASAASMRAVRSLHFAITLNGQLAVLPIKNAEGDLNADGTAKGTVALAEAGNVVQTDFVLTKDSLYFKGPTGGYQKLPATLVSSIYDPAAILDPDRGVAHVLSNLTDTRTEAEESVDGQQAYRISGKATKAVVSTLVPGVNSDAGVKVWVSTDARHYPVKTEFALPTGQGQPATTVDVTVSGFDRPVVVTAPQ